MSLFRVEDLCKVAGGGRLELEENPNEFPPEKRKHR